MREVQPHDQGSVALTGRPLAHLSADDAVTVLHATQYAALVRLATLLLRDRSRAEEVVQDAFVALHRRWARLDDRDGALGYLRTSVVNGARSAGRRDAVARRHAPTLVERGVLEDLANSVVRREQVLAALNGLSRRQREVVVLRFWLDLSEGQVAETLGISRGATKSHTHRATTALRETLRPLMED